MSQKLHEQVKATIQRHGMLRAGDRVGVGVSGGADSVALLLLLDELREELGITLLVAHFNHQLRGAESEADEKFVRELAAAHGVECVLGREDVAARAREHRWNLEDAARRLRYGFFEGLVSAGRVERIAVGHTADDQAETVLARLVRGTGPAGLAGIYPIVGHVVRPLLETRRQELHALLETRRQSWREDSSNRDMARLRSRIRHRVLPQIEQELQPAAVERLCALASRMREDESFWSAVVESCLGGRVVETPAGLAIRIADLLEPELPGGKLKLAEGGAKPLEALTRRMIRKLVTKSRAEKGQLTAEHVEQVLRLARAGTSGHQLRLPGGVVVGRTFDRLIFGQAARVATETSEETKSPAPAYEYEVALPEQGTTTVVIPEIRKCLRLKVIDWSAAARDTSSLAEILDRDLLRPPLVFRNWRPGDAYRPAGRQGVRKLKRLFVESRISARERGGWPVLTSAGKVAWAGRLPVAGEFAAGARTRSGLVIIEETL